MADFRPGGFQTLPPIVKNIIIINVLMVLIQFVLGRMDIDLSDYLGLHYWRSPKFHWWQIFTHIFMHGDPYDVSLTFWHIAGNMFALWMFGRVLENIWGPQRFLIFYFVCGVGAAFCHLGVLTYEYEHFDTAFMLYQQHPNLDQFLLFIKKQHLTGSQDVINLYNFWNMNPSSIEASIRSTQLINAINLAKMNTPTVGASGAVFGVLFAFGYLFPNMLLYLYFAIPIKAKWFVGGYALMELWLGVQNSAGDDIAHFAHIGGMVFAFILLRIWGMKVGK